MTPSEDWPSRRRTERDSASRSDPVFMPFVPRDLSGLSFLGYQTGIGEHERVACSSSRLTGSCTLVLMCVVQDSQRLTDAWEQARS